MKYDDAEYCFLDFQTGLAQQAAGTHIGFYLAWLLLKGHGSEESEASTAALRARSVTGAEALFDHHDGKLLDDDFDPRGNAFTAAYYEQHYFADFEAVFAGEFPDTGHPQDDACSIPDTWENQARMSAVLDLRWAQWEAGEAFAPLADVVAPPSPAVTTPATPGLPLARGPMPSMDEMLDRMQDGLRRFLGFESFLPDTVNTWTDRPTRRGRGFMSEFPGGCHWIELVAVRVPDERGLQIGMGVEVRSRIQSLAKAMAAIEIPGFGRVEDDDGEVYDSVYMWLHRWWGDGPLACLDIPGEYPAVYFRDETEIAPAIVHLARQAEGPLRKLLRRFETAQGLDAVLNAPPIHASPAFLATRMIQNVYLAEAMRNPRLHAVCAEVDMLSGQLPPSPDVDVLRAFIDLVRQRNP